MQSRSGVFSIASHCALQYLPRVWQVHGGCAHFLVLSAAIFIFLRDNDAPARTVVTSLEKVKVVFVCKDCMGV
jgi:hypothetical protein